MLTRSKLPLILIIFSIPILSGCSLFVRQNKIAGLQIFSEPKAEVFVNSEKKGDTPYTLQTAEIGDYEIKLATGSAMWNGRVRLEQGTIVVIKRQLIGKDSESPSGEILSLEKGSGIVVASDPDGAEVAVDDQIIGRAPISKEITVGEHKVVVSQEGYISRSILLQVHEGYRTGISVQLAKKESQPIATSSAKLEEKIVISQTPTGWVRVRDAASLAGIEIAKVNTDEEYLLLAEQAGWFKIRLKDGREGWITSQYATK